jgi:hypothetical protein
MVKLYTRPYFYLKAFYTKFLSISAQLLFGLSLVSASTIYGSTLVKLDTPFLPSTQTDTLTKGTKPAGGGPDSTSFFSKAREVAKENVKYTGGLGFTTAFYNSIGAPAQRDPFYWQIAGNLNIAIGQIQIPISATINQQERTFTQPFNQYGLSPRYKWATLHLGYRSMHFSEYSLSGNQFLGAGLELAPDNFPLRGKLLYGRFAKAVDGYYTDGQVSGTPSFERWGMGAQVEVGKPRNNVGMFLFKAKDAKNSITAFANDVTIKPAENLIFGFTTVQDIRKKLNFSSELNFSAYTRDTRIGPTVIEGYSFINNLGSLFYANSSTTFNKAMKADLSYTDKNFKIGLVYRRVDPDYLSMGSVYLTNDFEDIQLQTSFRLLKNKLNLALSGGLQRNNISNREATQMLRLIESVSITYILNKQWTTVLSLSNFNTSSHMVVVNELDTMRYAQVTKNASFQVMYNKVHNNLRIGTGFNGNYQDAKIFQNDALNEKSSSSLVNANYSFQLGFLKSAFTVVASLGGAMNTMTDKQVSTLGPTLTLNKRFKQGKLNTSVSASALKTYLSNAAMGNIINLKTNTNFRVNRHHSLTNTISLIQKTSGGLTSQTFLVTLGYNYVF